MNPLGQQVYKLVNFSTSSPFVFQQRRFSTSPWISTRFLKLKTIIYHGTSPIRWIPCTYGARPPGAVEGGHEDGKKLHVIRAHHEGGLFPGKLNCALEKAFIATFGRQHEKVFYEVLVAPYAAVKWVSWPTDKDTLALAIPGGSSDTGEPLLIGRAIQSNSLLVGKVDSEHEVCYVPYQGFAYGHKVFEILVQSVANPNAFLDLNADDFS